MDSRSYEEKIRDTIITMFKYRGYTDIQQIKVQENNLIIGYTDSKEKVCASIDVYQKPNVSQISAFEGLLASQNCNHGIIVHEESPTPVVKNVIENSTEIGAVIEAFYASDLQYVVVEHEMVPEHIPLSDEESNEFKKKYGKKLPAILRSDPVAKFLHLKRGNIVKIKRKNISTGEMIIDHRIVV